MKKIFTFTILHNGWEMDNEGWIIKGDNGNLEAFTTSHGGERVLTPEYLHEKIQETESSLNEMKAARVLMNWI